ncbi:hypothetical protein SEUCBS139899_005434 [Sporothrix eucalyptigena]|uniref:Xeroderma pigmentosum group C-complementing protein n=1 Tax=Sporothrix eucalyptigena TaxID=1812306 RepID=A0ABP0CTQ6_9PEZI
MVSTRRTGTIEHKAVSLRAAASQRQQQRQASARQRREDAAASATASDMGPLGVYRDMLIEAGVPSPAARRGAANNGNRSGASGEPPVKRIKRPGEKSDVPIRSERAAPRQPAEVVVLDDDDDDDEDEDEDEDIEFEDIVIPEPVMQTRELESEDEDDEDAEEDEDDLDENGQQFVFEDVSTTSTPAKHGTLPSDAAAEGPHTLELNLTEHESVLTTPSRRGRGAKGRAPANRKKPLSRAERQHRVEIHKMHLLCLMAHAAQRNRWCNSPKVHKALRSLLTEKTIGFLNPGGHLTQFGQTESLKTGLQQAATAFKTRYRITERGLRRALWAESPEQLKDYELPSDMETVLDKDDFIAAAKSMQGSRDVGAQLFCALLRSAGVETRLVCSLQPLSFLTNAPNMPKPKSKAAQATPSKPKHPIPSIYRSPPPAAVQSGGSGDSENEAMFLSPRRRLGHPDAAAYNVPSVSTSPKPRARPSASGSSSSTHVVRGESAYPVYWVEVLDAAHQKWQPVDPLVTCSQWRPAKLEPPAADKNNQMSYVIGFAAEGDAKDVTRRYAKAYNAKTKRLRIDGIAEPAPTIASATAAAMATAGATTASPTTANLKGSKWLRRALRFYRESQETDVDQIEDIELNATESREPMPRNVAEFQNHPIYALSRHLRRHEVLIPNATAVGTVAAGAKAPLERIYRRRDVRMAYSADRWYRLGRVVLPNEIPAKWLPKPVSRKQGAFDDDDDGGDSFGQDAVDDDDLFGDKDGPVGHSHPSPLGIPIFIPEQTEVYRAPPVVDGRIPKNKFGNIDLYVPSMVPEGGEHIAEEGAARAAFLLGVDYAPALSGFNFHGRKGTAVMRGVVVAKEHADAVRAILEGLKDLAIEVEAERRARAALRTWAFFLRGLRIRQRIRNAAEDRGEDVDSEEGEPNEEECENEDADGEDEEMDAETDGQQEEEGKEEDGNIEDAKSDVTEEFDMILDDDEDTAFAGGGGFLNDNDDYGGGGFIPE